MKKVKLQTETNTPEVQGDIENLIIYHDETTGHENCNTAFEHSQWWVICSACGASWSVVDSQDGLDLERIDNGDESCNGHAE